MNKSYDYYANRISHLAMTDPSLDATDIIEYQSFVYEYGDRLCLDNDKLWESIERFRDVTGDFYRANSHYSAE